MFLKLLILSLLLVAVAAAGFGITILLKKGGKFPDTHISHNKEMRKRGIRCAQHNDVGCNPTDDYPGCASCGQTRLAD
jgi:hypothetical protein